MQNFIQKTIKPFLILSGLFTTSTIVLFISPRFGIEKMLSLEFLDAYRILIQHWGMLVFLTGLFLILSAFITSWRIPIILFATIEKIFYAFLYFAYSQYDYSKGFSGPAFVDTIIVIYFILYLLVKYKEPVK